VDEAQLLFFVIKVHCAMLTSKGQRSFFGQFLDIGQAIVDAIFVQKWAKKGPSSFRG
jgi:hypothetical protein